MLNYGDKTIFPIILWQVYFTIGFLFGIKLTKSKLDIRDKFKKLFIPSILVLVIILLFKHSVNFPFAIIELKEKFSIVINRFPLNTYGFIWY